MSVRPAPAAPLRFRDDGIPNCPACALKILADPGGNLDVAVGRWVPAYHRGGHGPPVPLDLALAAVTLVIETHRYVFGRERDLRDGVATVLDRAGLAPDVEHRLDRTSRLDVYLPVPGVAVEVKCRRAPDLDEQLRRYAAHPRVNAIVLVTTLLHHGPSMARRVGDVPAYVIQLGHRGL